MSYIPPLQHFGEYEDNISSKRKTVSREEYLELLERTQKLEKRVRELEQNLETEIARAKFQEESAYRRMDRNYMKW